MTANSSYATVDTLLGNLLHTDEVVIYLTKRGGEIVGWRLADKNDHTKTSLVIPSTGEILDQFHGHARHNGIRRISDEGARYFVAYQRRRNGTWNKTNDGRLLPI